MQVWILVTLGSTAGLFVLLVLWHWQLARVFMLQHLQRSMEKQHLQPHSCSRVNGPSTAILIATAKLSALITTTYWRLVLCLIGKETHLLGWGGEHQTNHECLPLVQAFFFYPRSNALSSYIKSARNRNIWSWKAIHITQLQHPFASLLFRYLS